MLCIHDIIRCPQEWTLGGSNLKLAFYLVFYSCEKTGGMNGIQLKLTFCLVFFKIGKFSLEQQEKTR